MHLLFPQRVDAKGQIQRTEANKARCQKYDSQDEQDQADRAGNDFGEVQKGHDSSEDGAHSAVGGSHIRFHRAKFLM